MTAIRPIIACGLLIALVGCAGKSSDWVGLWTGNRDLPIRPGENELAIKTIGRVELRIHPDRRFDLFEGGLPKSGKLRYVGDDTAYLTIEKFMDRPIADQGEAALLMNKEIQLRKTDEGIEFRDPGGFDRGPIVLRRRASQPAVNP